jgi:hypothetical protein
MAIGAFVQDFNNLTQYGFLSLSAAEESEPLW